MYTNLKVPFFPGMIWSDQGWVNDQLIIFTSIEVVHNISLRKLTNIEGLSTRI